MTVGKGLGMTGAKRLRMTERNGIEITQSAACVDAQAQGQFWHLITRIWFRIRALAFGLCPGPVC